MVGGEVAHLLGLLADDFGGVVEVLVDELFVGDVDEWDEVGEGGEEKSQAPSRGDFDEEVGDEGGCEGLRCCQ